MVEILNAEAEFIRENLLGPFGFKGKYIDELWQVVVKLKSKNHTAVGLGVQSILWSDSKVFSENSPSGGNAIMFAMTNYALTLIQGYSYETPDELLDYLLPHVLKYGKTISNNPNMRTTFALNSLVAIDFAAWTLYAKEHNLKNFDDIIPEYAKKALSYKNDKLSRIPLITYGMAEDTVKSIMNDGDFFLKIKIGSDPDGDNDKRKMLEWDKKRISFIHNLAKDIKIPYTTSGDIPYYLDANGRYDSKEMLLDLLDHAKKIGALERIILLEEPFDEFNETDVHDIPVRVTADESAHCQEDAKKRVEMGYSAIALKPIAKTLTMSFRILKEAYEKNIPCFCADLTVNPTMVEWNKNVASRIAPLPGMNVGVLETNGYQNYKNWEQMNTYNPCYNQSFTKAENGLFILNDEFYSDNNGMFSKSYYYENLIKL